jgi:hypothetical protein
MGLRPGKTKGPYVGPNNAAATGDHKVLTDATDTTAEYLSPSLIAGTNVTLTIVDKGAGNNAIKIDAENLFVRPDDFSGGIPLDSSIDCSAYILLAITYAAANKKIVLLDKVYGVGFPGWEGMRTSLSDFTLTGTGWKSGLKLLSIPTYKVDYPSWESVLRIGTEGIGVSNVKICNFSIDLNGIEVSAISFRHSSCNNNTIENLEIYNSPNTFGLGYSWPALVLCGGSNYKVKNNYIHDVSTWGVLGDIVSGSAIDGEIYNVEFTGNHLYNFYATSAGAFSDSIIENNIFDGGTKAGHGAYGPGMASMEYNTRKAVKNIKFSKNIWRNSVSGLQLSPYFASGSIDGFLIDGDSCENQFYGFYIFGGLSGLKIINCNIKNCIHSGIDMSIAALSDGSLAGPKNFELSGNVIDGIGSCRGGIVVSGPDPLTNNLITDGIISNNNIKNHTDFGVYLSLNVASSYLNERFIICNNQIINNGSYGIAIGTSFINCDVYFNNVHGHSGGTDIRSSALSNLNRIFFNFYDTISWSSTATKPWMYGNQVPGNRILLGNSIIGSVTTPLNVINETTGSITPDLTTGNTFFVNFHTVSDITINAPINYDADSTQQIVFILYGAEGVPSSIGNLLFDSEYYLPMPIMPPSPGRFLTITFNRLAGTGWIFAGTSEMDMRQQRYEGLINFKTELAVTLGPTQTFIASVAQGSIIDSISVNVETAITANSPTVAFGIGSRTFGYSDFGSAGFTMNAKINVIESAKSPLLAAYDVYVNALDINGQLSTGVFTAGKIRIKIKYRYSYTQDNMKIIDSTVWDPGVIADGGHEDKSTTVPGAIPGEAVVASLSIMPVYYWTLTASVTAPNTITSRLTNNSGIAVDLPSGVLTTYLDKPVISITPQNSNRAGFRHTVLTSAQRYLIPFESGNTILDSTIRQLCYNDGYSWKDLTGNKLFDFTNCYCRYKMDEVSGNLVDQYGNYTGVASGALTYSQPGVLTNAIKFAGPDAGIAMGVVTQFGGASTFTIEMCINPVSLGGLAYRYWFARLKPGGFYVLLFEDPTHLTLLFDNGGSAKIALTQFVIGSWNHMVWVFNVGVVSLYINGLLQTTTDVLPFPATVNPGLSSGGVTTIGYDTTNAVPPMNGIVDEFALYTDAKNSDWVTKKYSSLLL